MAQKNATLRALIGETLYDLMPKGSVYNIYVDDVTTLAQKLQEMITSLNGKVTPEQLEEALADFEGGMSREEAADLIAQTLLEKGIIKREYLPDGYPYYDVVEIFSVDDAVMTDDGYPVTQPLGLEVGQTYEVVWNGTAYSCTAGTYTMDSITAVVLGDLDVLTTGEPSGAYPFVIIEVPEGVAEEGIYAACMPLDGSGTASITIRGAGAVPLDTKWLPEGYPYVLEGGTVVLEETTVSISSNQFLLPVSLNADVTYRVTWNGTDYVVAPVRGATDLVKFVYWGNPAPLGLAETEEPFVIFYSESADAWGGYATDGSTTAALKIITEKSYIPIDARYLPDGGALNLENGTASGSLRGKAAAKENETYSLGNNAMAVGYQSKAAGRGAIAYGSQANAEGDYSMALGQNVNATGVTAFAEGYGTTASGMYSHAEGYATVASEWHSHAEGSVTNATGRASHAEGASTTASGSRAHAEGYCTIAASADQHVQGKYNIEDAAGKYAHIVGNGTRENSAADPVYSNAHTLDWDGNAWFAGSVEGAALILTSPAGKRFQVTVDDSGVLTAAEITE